MAKDSSGIPDPSELIKKPVFLIVSAIIAIIVLIVVFAIPFPYSATEEYTEKEPYTTTEYYYEREPYATQSCNTKNLAYSNKNIECAGQSFFGPAKATYEFTNKDAEQGGYFTFWIGFTLPDGQKIGQETSKYIGPQSSQEFTYSANVEMRYCGWREVRTPTKQDCTPTTGYSNVRKSREV